MRLLLDAHLSPRRIGSPLETAGHDVLSLATDPTLGALDDEAVLQLAAAQERILVTRNARDFAPLLREWAETDRHHFGCILIWSMKHHEFGAIVDGVTRVLAARSDPALWRDLTTAI